MLTKTPFARTMYCRGPWPSSVIGNLGVETDKPKCLVAEFQEGMKCMTKQLGRQGL